MALIHPFGMTDGCLTALFLIELWVLQTLILPLNVRQASDLLNLNSATFSSLLPNNILEEIKATPLSLDVNLRDQIHWNLSSNGIFSINTAYKAASSTDIPSMNNLLLRIPPGFGN